MFVVYCDQNEHLTTKYYVVILSVSSRVGECDQYWSNGGRVAGIDSWPFFFLNIYDLITINYIVNDQIVFIKKSCTSPP